MYVCITFSVHFIGICTSNLNVLLPKWFPSWKPFQPPLVSTQDNFPKLWFLHDFQKLQQAQMQLLREIIKIISTSVVQKILAAATAETAAAGIFEECGVLFQQWNNSNYLYFRGKQRKRFSGRQTAGQSFSWEWTFLYLSPDSVCCRPGTEGKQISKLAGGGPYHRGPEGVSFSSLLPGGDQSFTSSKLPHKVKKKKSIFLFGVSENPNLID